MAMRMADTPTGGARAAYGVLAAVVAGILGALMAVMLYPLLIRESTCADDPTELCAGGLGLAFWLVASWLVLAACAYVFRLGWLFWLTVGIGTLVCLQAAVAWESLWPLAALLAVAPVSGWLTTPGSLVRKRRDEEDGDEELVLEVVAAVPHRRVLVMVGVCAVLVVQLAVWLWRVMTGA